MSPRARIASALLTGISWAALAGACSRFVEENPPGDAGADGGADGFVAAESSSPDAGDSSSDASFLDTSSGGPDVYHDSFDTSCGDWITAHGASLDYDPQTGPDGKPGSCRVCYSASDNSGNPPFIHREVSPFASGSYVFSAYSRVDPSAASPPAEALVGFQMLGADGKEINGRTNQASLTSDWIRTSVGAQTPSNATQISLTIELHGVPGACFDVDEVGLTKTN